MIGPILEESAVTVEYLDHSINVFIPASAYPSDGTNGVVVGLVVQVYAVGPQVATKELASVLIGLVVELPFVQCHTFLR